MKVEIYKAKDGWRWRAKAANGKIVADSGEAYERRVDCVHGLGIARDVLDAACYGTVPMDEVEA